MKRCGTWCAVLCAMAWSLGCSGDNGEGPASPLPGDTEQGTPAGPSSEDGATESVLEIGEDDPEFGVGDERFRHLPFRVNAFGATVFQGALYVWGGHTGALHDHFIDTLSNRMMRLDLSDAGAEWETLEQAEAVQQGSLFTHAGRMYRLGGMIAASRKGTEEDLHTLDRFERYDAENGTWEALPPMPNTRSSHGLTISEGVLYVIGGWQLTGPPESGLYHDDWVSIDLENIDAGSISTRTRPPPAG